MGGVSGAVNAADRTERVPKQDRSRATRQRLLEAAVACLAERGWAGSTVSVVAEHAGVSRGAAQHHFPTREDLVDAVYASELDAVTASAPAFLAEHPADVALRAWIGRYATFIATKRGMRDTLRGAYVSGRIPLPSRERVTATIAVIFERGAAAGTLRADVDPEDFTTLLISVFATVLDGGTPERTGRLLDLLVDAVRP